MPKNNLINNLLYLFYLGFLVTVVAAFRAYSSIAIGLILITSFLYNKTNTGSWFNKALRNPFVLGCSGFFLLQIIPLAYTDNISDSLNHIQVKSALLFIPVCFFCCQFINKTRFHSLMKAYVFILVILLTWCLGISFIKYQFHHAPVYVFFYHQLLSNLGHHAIQFSILVFAGLIFLLQETTVERYIVNKGAHFILMVFLIGGLFLLSSKLVISFTLVSLAYYTFISLKRNFNTRYTIAIVALVGITTSSLILFTKNPISYRFNDIMRNNMIVMEQSTFDKGFYFNGVQFRLLQWRFVKEIMQEHNAWIMGVTPAGAQPLLNQKYLQTNMYAGRPGTPDHGYQGYNTHNQWLESFLQTGFIGLLLFFVICFSLVTMAVREKSRLLWPIVLLVIAYSFSESVFETQYGLIVFLFLPLFFYFGGKSYEKQ
ncbi:MULTISPECIES: O-antigen ligase family protein [Niastella]|uniref:O-antigen ligase family protein n=1 Tax=Niastella soli TaxID=2821487 RepID=A0ABS3YMD3_9BACT|nr:O-antigen ligase family protein [Niastella soli]MBO9199028.1 O-antigen ligase family protein [Niastella soli]